MKKGNNDGFLIFFKIFAGALSVVTTHPLDTIKVNIIAVFIYKLFCS